MSDAVPDQNLLRGHRSRRQHSGTREEPDQPAARPVGRWLRRLLPDSLRHKLRAGHRLDDIIVHGALKHAFLGELLWRFRRPRGLGQAGAVLLPWHGPRRPGSRIGPGAQVPAARHRHPASTARASATSSNSTSKASAPTVRSAPPAPAPSSSPAAANRTGFEHTPKERPSWPLLRRAREIIAGLPGPLAA